MSLFVLPVEGCGGEDGSNDDGRIGTTYKTFEEFEATVYQEPGTGVYIVNGDTPIETREQLKTFYEEFVQDGALIVNRVGGVDDRWNDVQKLNLTYCVSKGFGGNYGAVVAAMASAASSWQSAAYVKFVYRSDQDASCNASNNNVVFDVSPTSAQPYLARAFFPNYSRASRNVLIDASSFGAIAPHTLTGLLRHELGHTLGFRHEHTRPEAGTCFEDNSWRTLTSYDAGSVMHYPWCNGTNTGDLVLTPRDKDGVSFLYGNSYDVRVHGPVGDFTGDGFADYGDHERNTGNFWVHQNRKNGTFAPVGVNWGAGTTCVEQNGCDVMVGDFTGDGYADYADRNRATGDFWIHKNQKDGTFAPAGVNWGIGHSCSQINCEALAGDFTGDGYADYADWDRATGDFWVHENLKNGNFAAVGVNWAHGTACSGYDCDVLVGDFTGDGYADYADRVRSTGDFWVHKNLRNGTFAGAGINWAHGISCSGKDCEVLVGDFTGDGYAEYADHKLSTGEFWVHENLRNGNFAPVGVNWGYGVTCAQSTCDVLGYRGTAQ